MLAAYKNKTEIQLGTGIVLLIVGRLLAKNQGMREVVGLLLEFGGWAVFTWGCMNYAEGKGYSKWLGLLGTLFCLGFVILVWLPDRHPEDRG